MILSGAEGKSNGEEGYGGSHMLLSTGYLAEFHAEQSCFVAAGEVLKHLKDRFPPNSQHAQKWMLWDQKYSLTERYSLQMAVFCAMRISISSYKLCFQCRRSESFRASKAVVLQAQNQMTEAHKLLQKWLTYCQSSIPDALSAVDLCKVVLGFSEFLNGRFQSFCFLHWVIGSYGVPLINHL